ncbi:hypothetical protein GCAAIG_10570 [Candidatus Electronema halotolerans]
MDIVTIFSAIESIIRIGIPIVVLYIICKVLCFAVKTCFAIVIGILYAFESYIIFPFMEKRKRKKENLPTEGQTIVGYILIFIGGATFFTTFGMCTILTNSYWCEYSIIESVWPFIGGVLLIITDVPLGDVPKPGLDAEICNDCIGEGEVKTGECEEYQKFNVKVQCGKCNGTGKEEYYSGDRNRRYHPNYVPCKAWRTCSSCDGKSYHIESRYRSFTPPRIVPIFSPCSTCEGTGYTGKHVNEIVKRNKIKGGLILSRTISLLYGIHLVLLLFPIFLRGHEG